MSYYSTVMNQLLQLIPRHKFDNLVKKYEVDRYVRYFNCWQLFITLLYAQIRKKDSLRDIETLPTVEASKEDYPEKLRLVGYMDEQTNKEFTFLTNNF